MSGGYWQSLLFSVALKELLGGFGYPPFHSFAGFGFERHSLRNN